MKEPQHHNTTDETLSPADRLEGLLYLYNQLHRSLLLDKDSLLKNITDHAEILKDFKNQMAHFARLETEVTDRIVDRLSASAIELLKAMDKRISAATTDRVDKVVQGLEQMTEKVSGVLEAQSRENESQFWKMVLAAVMAGLAVGMLSVYFLSRHLSVRLPEDQLTTYQAGQFVQTLWPKLSQAEQKRLMAIENGKLKETPKRFHHKPNDQEDQRETDTSSEAGEESE